MDVLARPQDLTFTLRQGVKFQDGEPFTSKDVKFSFERAAAKDSTNKEKAFFASIESIDASDPAASTLTFKEPSFQALYHLGLNTAVIVDEKSAATEATSPVGTGPYKFVAWNKGASATLEKWDGFRDAAKIAIKHVTFQFISDPSAEMAAMLAGDVDAFPRFAGAAERRPVPERSALPGADRAAPKARRSSPSTTSEAVRRPARPPGARLCDRPQGDHRRRAERPGAADRQPPAPNDPGYVDLTGAYPHDPEKAKALLKEAGVTTPLQVTLTLPPPDYARKSGEIIAAELADVGIQAKIENVEWAQWLSGVYKGNNFDLTIISHVEPLDIGIYANPDYYFQYDSQAFRDIFARSRRRRTSTPSRRRLATRSGRSPRIASTSSCSNCPNVTVADAHLQGLWKNAPIFANDVGAMSWKQ